MKHLTATLWVLTAVSTMGAAWPPLWPPLQVASAPAFDSTPSKDASVRPDAGASNVDKRFAGEKPKEPQTRTVYRRAGRFGLRRVAVEVPIETTQPAGASGNSGAVEPMGRVAPLVVIPPATSCPDGNCPGGT
jgi:hypothetical protein